MIMGYVMMGFSLTGMGLHMVQPDKTVRQMLPTTYNGQTVHSPTSTHSEIQAEGEESNEGVVVAVWDANPSNLYVYTSFNLTVVKDGTQTKSTSLIEN